MEKRENGGIENVTANPLYNYHMLIKMFVKKKKNMQTTWRHHFPVWIYKGKAV
jgi:hypothetical protein